MRPSTLSTMSAQFATSTYELDVHESGDAVDTQQHRDSSHRVGEEECAEETNQFMPARQLGLAVICCAIYLVSMLVGGIIADSLGAPTRPLRLVKQRPPLPLLAAPCRASLKSSSVLSHFFATFLRTPARCLASLLTAWPTLASCC